MSVKVKVNGEWVVQSGQTVVKNDSHTNNDIPSVPDWALAATKPEYTATEVGADPTGTAASKVSTHNVDETAHNDIRLALQDIANKLNTFLDSDDATLDELSELITAIKNNQTTISQLTSGKVNVTDIVNNLTTNSSNKPLSAAQGVALKTQIDAISIPTKVSQLTNDSGFITDYTETDPTVPAWAKASKKPTYTASEVGALPSSTVIPTKLSDLTGDSTHRVVTDTEKSTWNEKSNFSGSYNDLSNKPTIPSIAGLASETYVNDKVAAIEIPDVPGQINTHNAATDAHSDIRTVLGNKVNISDIINNLTTSSSNKPLSAAQGVALKALIDKITVPTKVSQLTNDSGYLKSYTETDPTVPSWAKASSKPSYTKSEVGLGNVDDVKQYSESNPPPYPVTSVNGETGAVTISALPAVTTADNGKVLMVVNGAWAVVDLAMSIDDNGVVSI